ncbi:MAG: hypothetical protein WCJ56_04170 [bacterium]
MNSSSIAKWQVITVPILTLLILNQAVTGLIGVDHIGDERYKYVHVYPGYFLVAMILFHLILNWGWIKTHYFKKK